MKHVWPGLLLGCLLCLGVWGPAAFAEPDGGKVTHRQTEGMEEDEVLVPRPLSSYGDAHLPSVWEKLRHRASAEPLNLWATALFLGAILHTFVAGHFRRLAHHYEREFESRETERQGGEEQYRDGPVRVSMRAKAFHFLGEVEAIFGIWCIPLLVAIEWFHGWDAMFGYLDHKVNFVEPVFVVVVMAIASTRPVIRFSEKSLQQLARLGGSTPAAWWLSILIVAPVLGSFITEPAAMTIAALLLARQFYHHRPSDRLKYATIGLLFVNISVGGTFTHFAAPPVLMVASRWEWGMGFMFTTFGLKALAGIVVSTVGYYFLFRTEFARMGGRVAGERADDVRGLPGSWADRNTPVPAWIIGIHLAFLAWTVATLHHPAFFIGGFLFFLAFVEATQTHQNPVNLRGPLLVGFFLAGLVTFGPLQQWWIAPLLAGLGEVALFTGAVILTAFNDNAAITFLASQVPLLDPRQTTHPELAQALRYAVVAGAVTGGGLTVIANAPNPAGQSILSRYFSNGVSPLRLFLWALPPTLVMCVSFLLFR